jgi:hypothetical protein
MEWCDICLGQFVVLGRRCWCDEGLVGSVTRGMIDDLFHIIVLYYITMHDCGLEKVGA